MSKTKVLSSRGAKQRGDLKRWDCRAPLAMTKRHAMLAMTIRYAMLAMTIRYAMLAMTKRRALRDRNDNTPRSARNDNTPRSAREDVLKTVSEILDKIDTNWVSRKDTSKRYLRYFSEALKKGNTPVKLYIIGILEKIGDFSVPELLARALEDRDRSVRLRAAKALKRIKV